MNRVKSYLLTTFGVVVVLLVVMTLLTPMTNVARPKARRSSCQSNLKQVGLAFRQYAQDFDEKFPTVSAGTTGAGWAVQMQPYLKSVQIFQCPEETTAGSIDAASSSYTDYWYNSTLAAKGRATISNAALTVISGDGSSRNSTYAFAGGGEMKDDGTVASPGTAPGKALAPDQDEGGRFGLRHLDGVNYVFVDGHVKWLKSTSEIELHKIWNGATPRSKSGQESTFNSAPSIKSRPSKAGKKRIG
jgi:prepilin-type processing-associated H-X9-DG protein